MNPTENTIPQIVEYIQKGGSGIIILPANPTTDAVASATSLYLGLTKAGKNITVACSTPVNADVTGADKIENSFLTKGDNLVISFPYTDGSIDKVDYNIQGTTFNLIITPRQGQPKLDAQKVEYSYAGGKVDFIIVVDSPSYNALGQIYTENQAEFEGKTVINIDRHLVNNMFGTVNFVSKTSSSTSELVLKVLTAMQIEIDRDMATNMYTGLTAATNYFTSYSVVPGTFEAAAQLLKLGAQKKPPVKSQPAPQNNQSQPQQQQSRPPVARPQAQPAHNTQQNAQQVQAHQIPTQQPQQAQKQQPQPSYVSQSETSAGKQNNQPQQAQNQQPAQAEPQMSKPAPQAQQTQNTPSYASQDASAGRQNNQPQQPTQAPQAHAPQAPQPPQNLQKVQEAPEAIDDNQQSETPQDWLKPKIFRSGGLL